MLESSLTPRQGPHLHQLCNTESVTSPLNFLICTVGSHFVICSQATDIKSHAVEGKQALPMHLLSGKL